MDVFDSPILYHGSGNLCPSLCASFPDNLPLPRLLLTPLRFSASDAVFLSVDVCTHPRSLHILGAVEGAYEARRVRHRCVLDHRQLLVV